MSDAEYPEEYRDIQRAVYKLKYANDKADFLSNVYMHLVRKYKDQVVAGTQSEEIRELKALLRSEIDHYRRKAVGDDEPDTIPRGGRPRRRRSDEPEALDSDSIPGGYITKVEVSKMTKYTPEVVMQKARAKDNEDPIPSHKIGRKVLFLPREVWEWLERQSAKRTSDELSENEALDILKDRMLGKRRR